MPSVSPMRFGVTSCWPLTRRLGACAPTDRNEPLLIVVLEPFTVGWQRLRFSTSQYFSERFETYRATSFVHSVRILDRVGPHVAVLVGLKLGAVELRPTFEHTDPVLQHGRLPSWDQVLVRGRSKELKARALKFRVRDGVLGDQPGGVRGSFADQALRRPSDPGHDRPEPQRILLVKGGHTWIIALVQRSRRRQLVTDLSVVLCHGDELVSNSAIHPEMIAQRATLQQVNGFELMLFQRDKLNTGAAACLF